LIPHPAASDSNLAPDGDRHARLVSLVEQMFELHKRLHDAETTAADRELYQRQIDPPQADRPRN